MSKSTRTDRRGLSTVATSRTTGDGENYQFGRCTYRPGGHLGPREQKAFQLVVLLSGSLRVTVDGAAYNLAPGDAILQNAGHRELYRFSKEQESEHSWCHISPRLLSRDDVRLLRAVTGVHKAPSPIHLLIEEGLAAGTHDRADLHAAMAAMARACLLLFAAHVRIVGERAASIPAHPALDRATELAATHSATLRSAGDLARRAGISTTHLRFLCRRAGRESPSAMLRRLKAERAIQLIRSTGLTLAEIADACGYANAFHLSRAVRQRTGHSPRSLRRSDWNR
ncbi:MAG: AraC family transcriptional regulator [Terrimicrobiaceae bacterium]|nr:AraC family transcriptional regulator [Terrimicrobiaceae bacterium]